MLARHVKGLVTVFCSPGIAALQAHMHAPRTWGVAIAVAVVGLDCSDIKQGCPPGSGALIKPTADARKHSAQQQPSSAGPHPVLTWAAQEPAALGWEAAAEAEGWGCNGNASEGTRIDGHWKLGAKTWNAARLASLRHPAAARAARQKRGMACWTPKKQATAV